MEDFVAGLGDARSSSSPARRGEAGAVTAEAALVLGLLVVVTAGLVWLVSLTLVQGRVQDAAREAARASARGETDEQARQLAGRVAPTGSRIELRRAAGSVEVVVATELRPLGVLGGLPTIAVRARAVAADEAVPGAP